jgi:hypothetical protein
MQLCSTFVAVLLLAPLRFSNATEVILLVCDQANSRVMAFDSDTGASLGVFGDASASASGMDRANSIARGADGNVTLGQLAKLFAEQGNFLGTLSDSGELVKT